MGSDHPFKLNILVQVDRFKFSRHGSQYQYKKFYRYFGGSGLRHKQKVWCFLSILRPFLSLIIMMKSFKKVLIPDGYGNEQILGRLSSFQSSTKSIGHYFWALIKTKRKKNSSIFTKFCSSSKCVWKIDYIEETTACEDSGFL